MPADADDTTALAADRLNLYPDTMSGATPDARAHRRCTRRLFIQPIPVASPERWFMSISVRSTGSEGQTPRLVLRWCDAEGASTANEVGPHLDGEGGADRGPQLMVLSTVLDGAARAVPLPATRDRRPGDAVIFDDARAIRLPDKPGEPD